MAEENVSADQTCLLWFTIRFTALLLWDELHFPWSAQIRPGPHITSAPVVPACADLSIQSSLTIGDKGKYVDPTQEATGSLTSQATSLWSCWQPWLSQQVTTQSSLFPWPGQALSCPLLQWLWDSLISLFSPERDYLSHFIGFKWEEYTHKQKTARNTVWQKTINYFVCSMFLQNFFNYSD